MGQAVAAFDLGEEALSHEEALLFKEGGLKHHIFPQLASPVRLAHDRQGMGAGDARRLKERPGTACEPMPKSDKGRKRIKTEKGSRAIHFPWCDAGCGSRSGGSSSSISRRRGS